MKNTISKHTKEMDKDKNKALGRKRPNKNIFYDEIEKFE